MYEVFEMAMCNDLGIRVTIWEYAETTLKSVVYVFPDRYTKTISYTSYN